MIGKLLLLLVSYEGGVQVRETMERHRHFGAAREYCDEVGKPLLRIGMRRGPFEPPNGDITLDLDSEVERIPGGVWADERDMPFRDKQFGVCFNEHTLEHLRSAEDVQLAVNECVRVADKAIFLVPSPYSMYSNLLVPTHNLRLWIDPVNNKILVRDNKWKTGAGFDVGISQALVSEEKAPQVITTGRSFWVM